ncbi:MAG: 4-hydroxy-tetrahydrodipicolinate reductase [Elusimicrobiota bacterium]
MISLTVCGAAGRMGTRILALAVADKEFTIVGAVEASASPAVGNTVIGTAVKITDNIDAAFAKSGVVIDFSSPTASVEHAETAMKLGKPIVIGTTGLNPDQLLAVKTASAKIAVVHAPNMSIGVNILFKTIREVAQKLEGYDVEIIEAHHNQKKDAPSGTAARFAEIIADTLNRDLKADAVYGREGLVGARKKTEIGVHAVRGGDIVGDHTIMFVGAGERVEITHRAHSRNAFASGAVYAAKWLTSKPAGLYDMQDVLGLK